MAYTVDSYRAELNRSRNMVVSQWNSQIKKFSKTPTPKQRKDTVDKMWPYFVAARKRAATSALKLHRDQSPSGYSPDLRDPNYPKSALLDMLDRTVTVPFQNAEAAGVPAPVKQIQRDATFAAARHVDMAAREVSVAAVREDEEAVAYARVLQGEYNCAFCIMLASRGAVYKSRQSAGETAASASIVDGKGWMNRYHDNCDCIVVPIFSVKGQWLGKNEWIYYNNLWKKATASENRGKDALNRLRNYIKDNPSKVDRYHAQREAA